MHKSCTGRVIHTSELRGECLQTVKGTQVPQKLRRKTLVIDDRLGNTRAASVLSKTCPCATARALQVDRGDLPIGRGWARTVNFDDRVHAAAAKRRCRLPRPVLTNVVTLVLTAMS